MMFSFSQFKWHSRFSLPARVQSVGTLQRLASKAGHQASPIRAASPENISLSPRTRRRQLALLDQGARTIIGNLVAGIVVVWVIHNDIGFLPMAMWFSCLSVISGVLLLRVEQFRRKSASSSQKQTLTDRRLREHFALATLVGVAWGVLLAVYGPMMTIGHLIIVSLILIGCASASLAAIGGYLPAFFGFFCGAFGGMIFGLFWHDAPNAQLLAFLVALYASSVVYNAFTINRSIMSALRLRARNEILAEGLAAAKAATIAANQSKWESFAHLSHELRTPMNAVLGFSDMMHQQMFGALSDRYREYAGCIHDSGTKAMELIDAILQISSARTGDLDLEEGSFDPFNLAIGCVDEMRSAAEHAGLTVDLDISPLPIALFADRQKMGLILRNLLENAVSFTQPGGRVALAMGLEEGGLSITVSDTGIGIAADDIVACQEPFVRLGDPLVARARGAGLGLPIARHFVEAHGGTLTLESCVDVGTTVRVLLPYARCQPIEIEQAVAKAG